jgi:hypothetical protein
MDMVASSGVILRHMSPALRAAGIGDHPPTASVVHRRRIERLAGWSAPVAVSGAGLAHCPLGAEHARKLLALAGRTDVPVACGRFEQRFLATLLDNAPFRIPPARDGGRDDDPEHSRRNLFGGP